MSDLKQIKKFIKDFTDNNEVFVGIIEDIEQRSRFGEENDIDKHNIKILLEIEKLQNEFQKQHFEKCVIFMVIIILGMIIIHFTD